MTTRAGFVALIGEPNAGKSTLLNRMVGAKVSIVTHKVQTTRARIRGVAMAGEAQIIFVDTPGLFRPRRRLDSAMVAAAWGGAADAEVIVLLIEAHRGLTEGAKAIVEGLTERVPKGTPVALAINKIDKVKAEGLLALTHEMNEAYPFAKTFMISAERGYGVEDLRDWLAAEGPALLGVKVDRMELVMPPKIEAAQVMGTAMFGLRAVLGGRSGEVVDLLRNNFLR